MQITKAYLKELNYKVVGGAIEVHKELGPGLLESIYQAALLQELYTMGLNVKPQVPVPVYYKGTKVKDDLYIDILVNDTLIIELKSVDNLLPIYDAQLLTYMKLSEKPKGLLINFNVLKLKEGIKPFVNAIYSNLPIN